ncbi:MAG: hypothetical protein J7M40_03290 [Planctomycetes bacterium]|nr:hypothetical protein [Planctomycetota bacterium]
MTGKRLLKLVHASSTAWFVLCAGFLLTLAMRQAGAAWWLIFSLSGYSLVLVFVLVSIYLLAVYRGVRRHQTEQEYPLTSSPNYMAFYDVCPFIGAIAGLISGFDIRGLMEHANMIAVGSLGTTFLVWIVLDPAIAFIEMYLPKSRKLRKLRLAQIKADKRRREIESEKLLAELYEKELQSYGKWQPILEPMAEKLAMIVADGQGDFCKREKETAQMGAEAWRLGGIACMRRLHEMAMADFVKRSGVKIVDYITIWWDGIGTWRSPAVIEILR